MITKPAPFNFYKKKYQTIKSVGLNPINWLFEACSFVINRTTPSKSHLNSSAQVKDITLNAASTFKDTNKLKLILEKHNICIIENFITHSDALKAGKELLDFVNQEQCQAFSNSTIKEYGEEKNFIWQTDYAWSDNYLEVAKHDKPVINIRARDNSKDDAGMIDFFNIQKLAKTESLNALNNCIEQMKAPEVENFMTKFTGYQRQQFNLYHNQGITRTRGPHIDNNSNPFKIFVYLTDVESESDGPYCYLPHDYKNRGWMSYERLINAVTDKPSTEVSSIEREQLMKIFGKAGTAIITNQSGVHCGWPQSEDAERILLVSNYY